MKPKTNLKQKYNKLSGILFETENEDPYTIIEKECDTDDFGSFLIHKKTNTKNKLTFSDIDLAFNLGESSSYLKII